MLVSSVQKSLFIDLHDSISGLNLQADSQRLRDLKEILLAQFI